MDGLLSAFEPFHEFIKDILIKAEADVLVGTACYCGAERLREYRCTDCDLKTPVCKECLVAAHSNTYFHWAERWNGTFFEREDMSDLGLQIHLGHRGRACPMPLKCDQDLEVVDINGIHDAKVNYCGCRTEATSDHEEFRQLLRHGLFGSSAGSMLGPRQAFTTRLLKDFTILTEVSKVSAYDYVRTCMKRTTENPLKRVSVRIDIKERTEF